MEQSDIEYRLRLCRRLLDSIPEENELSILVGLAEYTRIHQLLASAIRELEGKVGTNGTSGT